MCDMDNELYTSIATLAENMYGDSSKKYYNKVYDKIRNGLIEVANINGRIYIPKAECERLINSQNQSHFEYHTRDEIQRLATDYITCNKLSSIIKQNTITTKQYILNAKGTVTKIYGKDYVAIKEVFMIFGSGILTSQDNDCKIMPGELCIDSRTLETVIGKYLNRQLQRGDVRGEKINGMWYISQHEAEKLIGKSNKTFSDYQDINSIRQIQDYLTVEEVSRILGISASTIRKLIKDNIIETKIVFKEKSTIYYISNEELGKFKNKIEQYKNKDIFFVNEDIPSLFNISARSFNRTERILNFITTPEYFCNIKYFHSCDIDGVKSILSKKRRRCSQSDEYCSLVDSTKILGTSTKKIIELIQIGQLPNSHRVEKYPNSKNYSISIKDLDEYKKKFFILYDGKYITAHKGHKLFSISRESIIKNLSEETYEFSGVKYYKLEDIKQLSEHLKINEEQLKIKNELFVKAVKYKDKQSAFEYFKLLYCQNLIVDNSISESIDLCMRYLLDELKISKANNILQIVYKIGSILNYLIEKLTKKKREVYLYNNFEIENLVFNNTLPSNKQIELGKYANYVRTHLKDKCKYSTKFVRKYSPTNNKKEYYSFETFMEYAKYVSDIESHISNAVGNSRYAQIWLYIIMHFCTAWRSKDIIGMPYIDVDIVNVNSMDWFNCNELSISQCEVIIRKYNDNDYIANKTRNKLPFQVFKQFKECFATAAVICEFHRVTLNEDILLFNFEINSPYQNDYKIFFKKSQNLSSFGSLKANRSLLTNFYHYTNNETEFQKIAYFLARKLRGHVTDDMTWTYIHNLDEGQDIETASKFVFDNEVFGFIKYGMAEIIALSDNIEFSNLTISEKRTVVQKLGNSNRVCQIEGLNKFLLRQQDKRNLIIDELINMDKTSLIQKLQQLYKEIMPSYIPGCQCFKYPECVYSDFLNPSCEKCIYLIPNKHFLTALNNKINEALEKYSKHNISGNKNECLKSISYISHLTELLEEALDETIGLGGEVVKAYIDFKGILEKVILIQKSLLEEYEENTSAIFELLYDTRLDFKESILTVYNNIVPNVFLEMNALLLNGNLSGTGINECWNTALFEHLLITTKTIIDITMDEIVQSNNMELVTQLEGKLNLLSRIIYNNSVLDEIAVNDIIDRPRLICKLSEIQNIIVER